MTPKKEPKATTEETVEVSLEDLRAAKQADMVVK